MIDSRLDTIINAINSIKNGKQNTLVSGTNIKKINNESVLGSGNIETPDTHLASAELGVKEIEEQIIFDTSNVNYSFSNLILSLPTHPESSTATVYYPYVLFDNTEVEFTSFEGEAVYNYIVIARTNNGLIIVTSNGKLYYLNNSGVDSSHNTKFFNTTYSFDLPVKVKIIDENTVKVGENTIFKSFLETALDNEDENIVLQLGYSRDYRNSNSNCAAEFSDAYDAKVSNTLDLYMNNGEKISVDLSEFAPAERKPLKGMRLSILGDSISTFTGEIPEGYVNYYDGSHYGVASKDETWWGKLINETGLELLANASWGGSTVCGQSNLTSTDEDPAFAGCSTLRIADLAKNSKTPDIVICFIGINDFQRSNGNTAAIGTYTGEAAIPAEGTITDFSSAYALMLYKIMTEYPNAKVYACSLLESLVKDTVNTTDTTFPTDNTSDVTISQYNARIKTLCENLGVNFIDLHSCGINYWNLSTYTNDGGLHPNKSGMELIEKRIKATLLNDIK